MAILLRVDLLKRWLLVPIVSLLTVFAFPLLLYWRKSMQRDWLYLKVNQVEKASHIYIEGRDGNKEIVALKNFT